MRLSAKETEQLVESALNHKVLTEHTLRRDVHGEPTDAVRWTTTEKYESASYPRAGSLTDLAGVVLQHGWAAAGHGKALYEMVGVVIGALGIVVAHQTGIWLVYAAAGALLGILLLVGIRNERRLAAAMDCWPRMRAKHPTYSAWQHHWPRTLAQPAMTVWLYATLVVALEFGIFPWGVVIAVVGLLAAVPTWLWLRRWGKRWWAEVHA